MCAAPNPGLDPSPAHADVAPKPSTPLTPELAVATHVKLATISLRRGLRGGPAVNYDESVNYVESDGSSEDRLTLELKSSSRQQAEAGLRIDASREQRLGRPGRGEGEGGRKRPGCTQEVQEARVSDRDLSGALLDALRLHSNSQHADHYQKEVVRRPAQCDASVRWRRPSVSSRCVHEALSCPPLLCRVPHDGPMGITAM